ncbi:MAG TPA: NAD(P)H-binding protein [Microlunatus sp.]
MRLAIAGGTGLIGTMVAEIAEAAGHQVVVLARSRGIDLVKEDGAAEALDGVAAVVDVTNVTTLSAKRSTTFFSTVTTNLLAAERAAGVHHHVALSIVGVDRAPYGYYAGKRAQERLVEASPVPWTILRATQFHEMAVIAYESARLGPLHLAPRMRTRPAAAREVAQHLVDLVGAVPGGGVVEFAGPREESLAEMIRAYAQTTGSLSWIPSVSLPGALGRAQRDGTLLPSADAVLGRQTYADWVDQLGR